MSNRTAAIIQLLLGTLALLALLFMFLALADIAQGESDLHLEWRVAQIAFAVLLATTISNIALGVRARRRCAP